MRTLFLLVAVIVIGHGALQLGRRSFMARLDDTYGMIGIDDQGRVRHWHAGYLASIHFLSADQGEGAGAWLGGEEWQEQNRLVAFTGAITADLPRGWLQPRRSAPIRPGYPRSTPLLRLNHGHMDLVVAADGGAWFQSFEDKESGSNRLDRVPIDGDIGPDPDVLRGHDEDQFFGFVNDEFWVVGLDGKFVDRRPIGIELHSELRGSVSGVFRGARLLKIFGKSFRPDRVPLRLYLCRRGEPVLNRFAVLAPATEEQHWIASTFGIMAALRPLPLNLMSMAWDEPSTRNEVLRRWWLDPYLAQGANSGWLGANAMLTLLCAWVAWLWARKRCASIGAKALWVASVAVLGPTGLIWMRLSVPWYAIENGRAVNLGDWPAPELTGTEVFA